MRDRVKDRASVKDKRLQSFSQLDNQRRKMGQYQKVKGEKMKKEKRSNFSSAESQIKFDKIGYRLLVGAFLVTFVIVIVAIYVKLQAECGGIAAGDTYESTVYCQVYNEIHRLIKVVRTKLGNWL